MGDIDFFRKNIYIIKKSFVYHLKLLFESELKSLKA